MKRYIAGFLALVLCLFSFAGCKSKQPAAPAANAATTQTAGNLTVQVPAGWNLIADETSPDQVYLCKGGTNLNKNAYIKLTGNGALPAEGTCTDVQPLEARTYGSLSWSGFSGTKPAGSAIYLLTQTESTNILATVWCYPESDTITLEDGDVQAILAGVSYTAPTVSTPEDPEPIPTEPTSMVGDWSGKMEVMDAMGDLESENGAVYACIARIPTEDALPCIVVDQAGEITADSSGSWKGCSITDISMEAYNGQLSINIAVSSESSGALLVMTLSPLNDNSFDTLAAQYS